MQQLRRRNSLPVPETGAGTSGRSGIIDKKNEKVLFKPNLVRSAKRERAVVTDPAVMENVFRIFREQGYEHLACGDSCGIGSAGKAMKECHMDAALEKYGVELKEFQDEQRVETLRGRTLTLAKDVLEADALVSVCKMKTHALERVTGAVKISTDVSAECTRQWDILSIQMQIFSRECWRI